MRQIFVGLALALVMCAIAPAASAAVITVNVTTDVSGVDANCTLREAIDAADQVSSGQGCAAGTAESDTIAFNIGAGTPTITPATPLPAIDQPVIIDGSGTATRVRIDGSTATGIGIFGLRVSGGSSSLRSLVITGWDNYGIGIQFDTNGGNSLTNSYVGVNAAGTAADANTQGVRTQAGSTGNTFGGTTPADRNVLAGNEFTHLRLDTANNVVTGNYIGVSASGLVALGGADSAMIVAGASGNQIGSATGTTPGGACTGGCNVISGSMATAGLLLAAPSTTVISNYIGTDVTGTAALPNPIGISVGSAAGSVIGGATPSTRNVVSGNSGVGITGGATDLRVRHNYVGLDTTGLVGLGNGGNGISLASSAAGMRIGVPGDDSLYVADNGGHGIAFGTLTGDAVVANARVGLNVLGASAGLGNAGTGIRVGGDDHRIGGTTPGERNVIAGNGTYDIVIGADADTPIGTRVTGNYIGTAFDGVTLRSTTGVRVTTGFGTIIGGANASPGGACTGACNVIANSSSMSIHLTGDIGTQVFGNHLGADASGTPVGSAIEGVYIQGAIASSIGGDAASEENLINTDSSVAIYVRENGTDNNVIGRNRGAAGGARFVDLNIGAIGLGNDAATGPNGGVQAPVLTAAGATFARGTATPGATIRVYASTNTAGTEVLAISSLLATAVTDAGGAWRAAYAGAVSNGAGVAASQTVAKGSSELTLVAASDAVIPDTTITVAPPALSKVGSHAVSFNSDDPAATFLCVIDSGPATACAAPLALSVGDGSHTVRVSAVDATGNEDTSPASTTFQVDTAAPVGSKLAYVKAPAKSRGFTYRSTEAGKASLLVEQQLVGRKVGAKCLPPKKGVAPKPKCTRFVSKGRLTGTAKSGANRIAFAGKVGRTKLPRGSYRGTLTITDAAGNVSKVLRVTFRV